MHGCTHASWQPLACLSDSHFRLAIFWHTGLCRFQSRLWQALQRQGGPGFVRRMKEISFKEPYRAMEASCCCTLAAALEGPAAPQPFVMLT